MEVKLQEDHLMMDMSGRKLTIPKDYQQCPLLPEDPVGSFAFRLQNNQSRIFILISPIADAELMPNIAQQVIDGIHDAIDSNKGLIEVKNGRLDTNGYYIYSIAKSRHSLSGIQYNLTLHLKFDDQSIQIQGFFEETGMTGMREAQIIEQAVKKGLISRDNMAGWLKDPYDADFSKGILMNLSEKEEFDENFPSHPLTMLRVFLKTVIPEEKKDVPGVDSLLCYETSKASAKGKAVENGFLVCSGSQLSEKATKSCPDSIKKLRRKYKKYIDENFILQQDLLFETAAQAAGFVGFSRGSSTNWQKTE